MTIKIEQLPLPLTPILHVGTLHLQPLDVSTSTLVMKRVGSLPAIRAGELPVSCDHFLSLPVAVYTALAVDTPTTRGLIGVEGDQRANLTH